MKRILSYILTLTMIVSIIGSITFIDVQTAYARKGVDVNGNTVSNYDIYQPTDDPVFYYQPPVDEEGNHDYFGYPMYGDPQDITDEEFFGKWDSLTNTWVLVPYFDYNAYPDMALIEDAVKQGDYESAKKELKNYYKNFTWKIPETDSVPAKAKDTLEAMSRNVFAYSYISMVAMGKFELPAENWGKAEISVLSEIKSAKGSYPEFNIMVVSADKFWTTGQYYSKDAADPSVRPKLQMIVNNVYVEKEPIRDTMVVGGAERDTNYGYDEIIELQEHCYFEDTRESNGACDDDTKRSFICFDISDIRETDKVTSAKLVLTGRNIITDETRQRFADENGKPYSGVANNKLLWATWYRSSAWEEDTLTWGSDYYSDKFFFSCHDMNAWDYISSATTTVKGKVCDYHRYQQQGNLTDAYRATGDERYAYTDIRHCMALINSIGLEPSVMNSLDMSVYLANLCYMLYGNINSKYMTDEIFTALLKFVWQICDYETEYRYGVYTNNWATYATAGNYKVCAYFPEFKKHDYWFQRILEEHDRVFAGLTLEDGHCLEASHAYVSTLLGTFQSPMNVYRQTGKESPYSEEIHDVIYDIVKTAVYSSVGAPNWSGFNIADTSDIGNDRSSLYKYWYQYLFEEDEELKYVITDGMSGKMPENPTTHYPVALRTFMRSSWDATSNLAMSFINTSPDDFSHGHNDALSITMFAYGKYLLTDQGYGSDQTSDSGRVWRYNKSPVQHNLVTINDTYDYLTDGVCQYTVLRSNKQWEKKFESNRLYDFIEYVCDGYSTAQTMQRSVTFMKNQKFWIVSDYAVPLDPTVENVFAQHWHVYPGANPSHNEEYVLRTNFDDVNVMVVPMEYEEIDDLQYVDRLYSDSGGLKITDKKAMITKSKTGAAKFTTVILPVNIGENFEVTSKVVENENELDDNLLNMAYFKITETSTNKTDYYYYYHINDAEQKPAEGVKFANFITDATTLVIQQNEKEEIVSVLITDGSYVKFVEDDGTEKYCFKSDDETTISYARNGQFVNVVASEYDDPQDLQNVQIYMENIMAARLDGDDVNTDIENNIITFKGSYGSSNITSGGGAGGGGAPKPTTTEEPKKEETQEPELTTQPENVEKPSTSNQFKDVKEDDWYFEYVNELTEKGVVSGDGTGKFNPTDKVTREQFLKMIIEATGIQTEEAENTFDDVADDWYKPYVLKAKNLGIVNGVSDTEFGIGSNITRQDMAVMIFRTIEKMRISVEGTDVDAFADGHTVSDYATEAVEYVKSIGLIEGYNNEYRPHDTLTRAEASKVIFELLNIL